MNQIFKAYRIIVILSVIGGGAIFFLNLVLLSYGEVGREETYLSLKKLVVFSLVLWGVDKVMVMMGLLSAEPEYLGFIKKLFRIKKKDGG